MTRTMYNPRSTRRYRRNPGLTAEDIAEVAEAMGKINLAKMLRYGPAAQVAEIVQLINEAVDEDDQPEEKFTDRKAWEYLAKISGEVGAQKGWPAELISGLKAAFQAKAAAA